MFSGPKQGAGRSHVPFIQDIADTFARRWRYAYVLFASSILTKCLVTVLLNMITAARGSYNRGPIFLGISTTLIRILARWEITSFSEPTTHREFILLVKDMRRYFERCVEQNVPFGYAMVDRLVKRVEMVVSRFALTYEDQQELKAIIAALEKGKALGLSTR